MADGQAKPTALRTSVSACPDQLRNCKIGKDKQADLGRVRGSFLCVVATITCLQDWKDLLLYWWCTWEALTCSVRVYLRSSKSRTILLRLVDTLQSSLSCNPGLLWWGEYSHRVQTTASHSFVAGKRQMASSSSGSTTLSYHKADRFFETWNAPQTSGFSYRVLAMAEETSLSEIQIQFIADFYEHRTGKEISASALIDECDKYTDGQLAFPERLAEVSGGNFSASGGGGGHHSNAHNNPVAGATENNDSGNFNDEDSVDGSVSGGQDVVDRFDIPDGANTSCLGRSGNSRTRKQHKPVHKSNMSSSHRTTTLPVPDTTGQVDSGLGYDTPSDIETDSEVEYRGSESNQVPNGENARTGQMQPEQKERWLLQNVLLALQREHEILDMSRKCNECKTRPRDITFLPCGHFIMCKVCSEPVFECPTCNLDILATAQTFLS
ncbi:uncharacterized protein LOC101851908 isoform X2 [Aplysia californica]|uniref:Uncharacterized protein LOC101851908 isoform X2 n=1 Tax=Aplysia californica TaxID=6500 RepID=A0ABM0K931_APLCA|nr:uncharacterized protein LOC101851908 isoform X2 [Aplysia californica]